MTDGQTAPIRVLIVDDHAMVRSGVRAELSTVPGVQVVAEAEDVDSAVSSIRECLPDVVLLDVHLPGGPMRTGGSTVLTRCTDLLAAQPPVRFLALSVSDAAQDVIEVIRAGARGYVTKTITGPELADAVRRVFEGDAVFSPRLAGFVLDAFGAPAPAAPAAGPATAAAAAEPAANDDELNRLSAREAEVMRYIARGYSYREVGAELFISVRTVESHVSAVLRKLQLSSRHELTRWAADRRLL